MKTWVHLHQELYLLVSLTLLSIAGFQIIYQEKFGLPGDYQFCFLTSLWLSRYLLIRWICTWDTSTCASPTIGGVLAHFISSHILSGQYFDRPSPQAIARQGVGLAKLEDDGRTIALSAFVWPSILAAWNLLRVRLFFPLIHWYQPRRDPPDTTTTTPSSHYHSSTPNPSSATKRKGSDRDASSTAAASNQSNGLQRILAAKAYNSLAALLQISIPALALFYYTWRLAVGNYLLPGRRNATVFDPTNLRTAEQPGWSEVWFVASLPTVVTLLVFTRLINPIPDLLAGSNVLKTVRNEAKSPGLGSKSSKSKPRDGQDGATWAERDRSMAVQNRLRSIAAVALLRVLENVFVVGVLPWTGFACRATGHCREIVQLWQLSAALFPVGVHSALRPDAAVAGRAAPVRVDAVAAVLTAVSVVVVSLVLLVAQAVSLNGSHLAITGHICGEWTKVDFPPPDGKTGGSVTPQWDPKRRYKKGDVIVVNRTFWFPRQVHYQATSSSPEGRPSDLFLQAAHQLFRDELGHPSTSKLMALTIQGHLAFIAFLMIVVLFNSLFYGNDANKGLEYALGANIVACNGLVFSGKTDRSELRRLSESLKAESVD